MRDWWPVRQRRQVEINCRYEKDQFVLTYVYDINIVPVLVQQPRKKGKQKASPSAGRESVAKRIRRNKMEEEDEGTSSDQLVDMYVIIMLPLLYVNTVPKKVWMTF